MVSFTIYFKTYFIKVSFHSFCSIVKMFFLILFIIHRFYHRVVNVLFKCSEILETFWLDYDEQIDTCSIVWVLIARGCVESLLQAIYLTENSHSFRIGLLKSLITKNFRTGRHANLIFSLDNEFFYQYIVFSLLRTTVNIENKLTYFLLL